jgi:hypothetical protein
MTSSVKVTAHCASDKQVIFSRTGHPDVVLQDGESHETYFYDDMEVSAREVNAPPASQPDLIDTKSEPSASPAEASVIPADVVAADSTVGGDGPVKG